MSRYIILPSPGSAVTAARSPLARGFLLNAFSSLTASPGRRGRHASRLPFKVVDSIHEDGAKLVEIAPGELSALRASQPDVRILPEVFYERAWAPRLRASGAVTTAKAGALGAVSLTVVSAANGQPVAGAYVVVLSDAARGLGADGTTNAQGKVRLRLAAASRWEIVAVYPALGFWSLLRRNVTPDVSLSLPLRPLNLATPDVLRAVYGQAPDGAGQGVRVGVVDSGIALDHPDLVVAGGLNTVSGQDSADFGPAGDHGTHVAGIIAARGSKPTGIRGLAPAATVYSYRVFGSPNAGASSFAIAKAVDQAIRDGCHLLNFSLGAPAPDEVLRAALDDARAAGILPIVATGNDGRAPVSYPAAEQAGVAVTAYGRKGTFPVDATESLDVKAPYGKNPKNFIAAFSNVGEEVDATGPGVGVISTVPDGYAPMSGTSMACPAVTGRLAALLTGHPQILGLAPDAQRTAQIAAVLRAAARPLGFGPTFEGSGGLR